MTYNHTDYVSTIYLIWRRLLESNQCNFHIDLCLANRYINHSVKNPLVDKIRIELITFGFSDQRSNLMSYLSISAGEKGI